MEIRNTRYQELVRKEITFDMIRDFLQRERGEISDKAILDHIEWLISFKRRKTNDNEKSGYFDRTDQSDH